MKAKKTCFKHFIADPELYEDKLTFLSDKKVDAELYALLMQFSYGGEGADKGKTVVYKSNLPKQKDMCDMLRIKSTTTLRTHLKYLVDQGYINDMGDKLIIDTYKEDVFLRIPLETIEFLNDTVKESVWKVYLYLGQRWSWKKNQYVFTLEELAIHIGRKINNNSDRYKEIKNILQCLKNNGLIDWTEFSDGQRKYHRLVMFNLEHKRD